MIDTTESYSNPSSKSKNKIVIIISLIVVIAAIAGGILFFRQSKQTEKKQVAVIETTTPAPKPTEQPKIDKNSVKIQVTNGTGTPGQAGTVVEVIKKAGYNGDNITTANATDFNTSATTITAKAGFEAVASDISDILKTTFTDIKIDSSQLDSKSAFDIVIVTGGKTFEAVTPTKSISPTQTSTITPVPSSTTPTVTPIP